MRSCVIAIPMWGANYINIFEKYAFPSLMAALEHASPLSYRFIIHTDDEERVSKLMSSLSAEIYGIKNKPTYVTLQESHADALTRAHPGEIVIFLNADLVLSRNFITQIQCHIKNGYEAVVLAGIRTTRNDNDIPMPDQGPRELLQWAWLHRHQIIKDLEWGTGTSMLPTNVFFVSEDEQAVVLRGFHLHPAAVLKKENISFVSTIDGDLLEHYPRDLIKVVTAPDDMAMFEVSPPDRRFPVGRTLLQPVHIVRSMSQRATELHRWLFDHRIIVKGEHPKTTECGDDEVADAVLAMLAKMPPAEIRPVQKRGRR